MEIWVNIITFTLLTMITGVLTVFWSTGSVPSLKILFNILFTTFILAGTLLISSSNLYFIKLSKTSEYAGFGILSGFMSKWISDGLKKIYTSIDASKLIVGLISVFFPKIGEILKDNTKSDNVVAGNSETTNNDNPP